MTRYVLSLTGEEQQAANATHWARFRNARLLARPCASKGGAPAVVAGRESVVILAHGHGEPVGADGASAACAPDALAALLVGTLDIQDGMKVVLAASEGPAFAADLATAIALLGRQVTCTGEVANLSFSLVV